MTVYGLWCVLCVWETVSFHFQEGPSPRSADLHRLIVRTFSVCKLLKKFIVTAEVIQQPHQLIINKE